jgi:hypothetical protein
MLFIRESRDPHLFWGREFEPPLPQGHNSRKIKNLELKSKVTPYYIVMGLCLATVILAKFWPLLLPLSYNYEF